MLFTDPQNYFRVITYHFIYFITIFLLLCTASEANLAVSFLYIAVKSIFRSCFCKKVATTGRTHTHTNTTTPQHRTEQGVWYSPLNKQDTALLQAIQALTHKSRTVLSTQPGLHHTQAHHQNIISLLICLRTRRPVCRAVSNVPDVLRSCPEHRCQAALCSVAANTAAKTTTGRAEKQKNRFVTRTALQTSHRYFTNYIVWKYLNLCFSSYIQPRCVCHINKILNEFQRANAV